MITREDRNIHFTFSPSHQPLTVIKPGDQVVIETRDASNGQIRPRDFEKVDRKQLLPVTGPVAVQGATPGDCISVRIDKIRVAETAYSWLRPGLGIRSVTLDKPFYVAEMKVGEKILLPSGAALSLRPMIGIVGVSPVEEISTRYPGPHGGNLDSVDVAEGNVLWLPVFVPGANISFGDAHAAMGEGEVCGTGAEIEATITATVNLHREMALEGPVITTDKKTAFLSSSEDLVHAVKGSLERAVRSLMEKNRLSEQEATITASLAGNARICQLVNGKSTASFELPKEVFIW